MKIFLVLFFLAFSSIAERRTLLNILEEDTSGFSIKKQLKKDIGSVFPDSLNSDSFVRAFEDEDFKKSLKIWNQRIARGAFSKSSTGHALYAYLLFKNGFEYLALHNLFTMAQAKEIDPIVRHLWKRQNLHPIEKYFYFPIEPGWGLIFEPEFIVAANSKNFFDFNRDHELMKNLLSLPLNEEFDNFAAEWSFLLSFLKRGDREAAGKLLSYFLSQKKYADKKDKINLTIGRLLADLQEFPAALSYYKKLEGLSYLNLQAREEMSWIFLNQKKWDKAWQTALVFSHPGLNLNPSMLFVLALAQLKNCDNEGAFQTLKSFKKAFSTGYDKILKYFFDRKDFEALSKALLEAYESPFATSVDVKASVWPYLLQRDQKLKNQILLYNYLEGRYLEPAVKASFVEFKGLHKRQKALIEKTKKKRDQRIFELFSKVYQEREIFLKQFQILEAEILYQYYAVKSPLSAKIQASKTQAEEQSLNRAGFLKKAGYKSKGFFYFPFQREEIWLDELFDYKAGANKYCLKSKPLQLQNKEQL